MTYKFTVGEYTTEDGGKAVVSEIFDGCLFGRRLTPSDSFWFPTRWSGHGANIRSPDTDLVPPTHRFWVATWMSSGGTVQTDWSDDWHIAMLWCQSEGCTKIDITGPYEVPV